MSWNGPTFYVIYKKCYYTTKFVYYENWTLCIKNSKCWKIVKDIGRCKEAVEGVGRCRKRRKLRKVWLVTSGSFG